MGSVSSGGEELFVKQTWKQFLSAAGGPPAFVTDQKNLCPMVYFSEILEKAGGKSRPQPKKFVSKAVRDKMDSRFRGNDKEQKKCGLKRSIHLLNGNWRISFC